MLVGSAAGWMVEDGALFKHVCGMARREAG